MKDKDSNLEEIEASHTLGGAVIRPEIRQSRGLRQTMPVWVTITVSPPVYKRYRGGGERGGCGFKSSISAVIHT